MIKQTIALLIVCLAATLAFGQGISFEEVTWQEALDKAKTENKLLFVDAYAKWCGPCKKMAKYEFTKVEVGEFYNANFVNLKLDMETANGRTFDAQYPVSAYPTMLFLDGDGKVVKKIKGGKKGDQLIKMGKNVLGSHDFSGDWRVKYDEGDRSYETVFNYVKTLNQSGKPSLKIANEYLKSDAKMTDAERFAFKVEALSEADSKLYDEVVSQKSEAIALIGEEQYNSKIRKACDNTAAKAIEYDYPELLDEAITKANEGLTNGADEYALTAKKKYAVEMRDAAGYEKALFGLSKIYLKNDVSKMEVLLNELLNGKVKSEKLKKMAVDLSKKYHKKEQSATSVMMLARSMAVNKEYKKAVKALDKTINRLKKEGQKTKTLENFKKVMEKKQA